MLCCQWDWRASRSHLKFDFYMGLRRDNILTSFLWVNLYREHSSILKKCDLRRKQQWLIVTTSHLPKGIGGCDHYALLRLLWRTSKRRQERLMMSYLFVAALYRHVFQENSLYKLQWSLNVKFLWNWINSWRNQTKSYSLRLEYS